MQNHAKLKAVLVIFLQNSLNPTRNLTAPTLLITNNNGNQVEFRRGRLPARYFLHLWHCWRLLLLCPQTLQPFTLSNLAFVMAILESYQGIKRTRASTKRANWGRSLGRQETSSLSGDKKPMPCHAGERTKSNPTRNSRGTGNTSCKTLHPVWHGS